MELLGYTGRKALKYYRSLAFFQNSAKTDKSPHISDSYRHICNSYLRDSGDIFCKASFKTSKLCMWLLCPSKICYTRGTSLELFFSIKYWTPSVNRLVWIQPDGWTVNGSRWTSVQPNNCAILSKEYHHGWHKDTRNTQTANKST